MSQCTSIHFWTLFLSVFGALRQYNIFIYVTVSIAKLQFQFMKK